MEPYSLIIGLFFVALFVLPVWFFQRSQNKEKRVLTKSFKQAASANGLSISQADLWHNIYGIGFDEKNKKLLYLKHSQEADHSILIDLRKIDKCSIQKQVNRSEHGKGSNNIIEKLNLVLVHNDDKNVKDSLEFYNEAICQNMDGDQNMAEKWQKFISAQLAS